MKSRLFSVFGVLLLSLLGVAVPRAAHAQAKIAAYSALDTVVVRGLASATTEAMTALAEAAALLRDRILRDHMLAGVTIVDPATTWIDVTVRLEADVTVHPFTILRGATRVGTGAEIHPLRARSRREQLRERRG